MFSLSLAFFATETAKTESVIMETPPNKGRVDDVAELYHLLTTLKEETLRQDDAVLSVCAVVGKKIKNRFVLKLVRSM